jgi:hypothetical protein
MTMRVFYDYVTPDGENVVEAWIESLTHSHIKGVRAALDNRLQYLQTASQLDRPYVGILHGDATGLIAIHLKVKNVQYRVLSCYGPANGQVTMLGGCTERDGEYVPSSACPKALERKALLYSGRGRVCERDIG